MAEERYSDASVLRDAGGAGLLGWWAGKSEGDPHGHLLRVTADYSRYMGHAFTPRDLAELNVRALRLLFIEQIYSETGLCLCKQASPSCETCSHLSLCVGYEALTVAVSCSLQGLSDVPALRMPPPYGMVNPDEPVGPSTIDDYGTPVMEVFLRKVGEVLCARCVVSLQAAATTALH